MGQINKTRSGLYRAARFLGDINAVSKGPGAVIKRQGRKSLWKAFARLIRPLG
jgi:hypothetical protein